MRKADVFQFNKKCYKVRIDKLIFRPCTGIELTHKTAGAFLIGALSAATFQAGARQAEM
ncbi:hypothetical protein [Janthinobacterium fluminis]|uniref:hypothetical protein n=1 Tax=Janthinobacterium fluminis TaxID=2987524 RepID=UPI0023580D21|nr:hypothetical protein [Janthinobacterium fluminis]